MYQDSEGIFHRQFAESRDKSGKWTSGGEAGHGSPEGSYAKNGDKWQHTTASPKKTDDTSVTKVGNNYKVHVGGQLAGRVTEHGGGTHMSTTVGNSLGLPQRHARIDDVVHNSVHEAIDRVVAHGRQKQLDTVRSIMKNRP